MPQTVLSEKKALHLSETNTFHNCAKKNEEIEKMAVHIEDEQFRRLPCKSVMHSY